MSTLFGKPQTVTRTAITFDAHGIIVVGAPSTIVFEGTVQPADQNSVKSMAQGRENDGSVVIYSDTRLEVSKEETGRRGDRIEFNGMTYELAAEQVYDNALIPHFKYLAFAGGVK